ncbi:MAG: hypothetical protein LBM75_10200 [Myxococcales bacterium]|nr:hypothetical protein [Myxococcales bacterium]
MAFHQCVSGSETNDDCADGERCVDGRCVEPLSIACGSIFGCSAAVGGGAMLIPLLAMGWALRRRRMS